MLAAPPGNVHHRRDDAKHRVCQQQIPDHEQGDRWHVGVKEKPAREVDQTADRDEQGYPGGFQVVPEPRVAASPWIREQQSGQPLSCARGSGLVFMMM